MHRLNSFYRILTAINKAIRTIFCLPPRSPTAELKNLSKQHGLLQLDDLVSLALAIHVFSTKHKDDYPSYFENFLAPSHSHSTRFKTSGSLFVLSSNSTALQRTVHSRSIQCWNRLAKEKVLPTSANFHTFRCNLISLLLSSEV